MPGVRDDGGGAGTLRAREHRRSVEHARTACPRGHHFLLSIDALTRPPLPTPRSAAADLGAVLDVQRFESAGLDRAARDGHEVRVQIGDSTRSDPVGGGRHDPDLVICPFLRERVPVEVWTTDPPSSSTPGHRATVARRRWTGRSLDARTDMGGDGAAGRGRNGRRADLGDGTFPIDAEPPRKSALYNGLVADAAIGLIREVVIKAADPGFRPEPLDYDRSRRVGADPTRRQQLDRQFSWSDTPSTSCAVSAPRTAHPARAPRCAGFRSAVYDAHRGTGRRRRHRARSWRVDTVPSSCAPATARSGSATSALLATRERGLQTARHSGPRRAPPRRRARKTRTTPGTARSPTAETVHVGVLSFRFYNGAMSTGQCRTDGGGAAPRRRPGHQGAGPVAAGRPSPTASTSASSKAAATRPPRPGKHQRHRRRVPGDHQLTANWSSRAVGGNAGRRRRHAGARR